MLLAFLVRDRRNIADPNAVAVIRDDFRKVVWVIISLVSAVSIVVLLAISGPALAALLSQVLEKFG